MNLREHYKSTMSGPTAFNEALKDTLVGAAKGVGKGALRLVGGPEGLKKAAVTSMVNTLTGLDSGEIERYYDRVIGTREGGIASSLYKALNQEGIPDVSHVSEEDFVVATEPQLKALTNSQKFFYNNNIKLFAISVYAISKMWNSVNRKINNEEVYELDDTPLDIAKYFTFEADVKRQLESKFKKYKVNFLANNGGNEETTLKSVLSINGAGINKDDFMNMIDPTFLGLIFKYELLKVQYNNDKLVGIKFTPGNMSGLYNVLATFIHSSKKPTTPAPNTPPQTAAPKTGAPTPSKTTP